MCGIIQALGASVVLMKGTAPFVTVPSLMKRAGNPAEGGHLSYQPVVGFYRKGVTAEKM